ncbi:ATP-binding protein [Actinorugispora endophytica]|uniref:Anti-sigma regulatory factor (Ser/Thr protein kinase) n=1 Tax=Actinorugispora endophytica TaxID=1605990 RepID=A0A4R6UMD7_9ACTN|nr:ATP-binding protein [Actinorugispora endophytica]TDQ46325.1 anti-sigma regulatory factor (Ser/Thr protein kinase) [Actinorugispora endophytica]
MTAFHEVPPPSFDGAAAAFATTLAGVPANVAVARRWTRGVLALAPGARVPEPVVDTAVLLVSECAANAVTHTPSGRPGQVFGVHVRVAPGRLRAEVRDRRPHGSAAPRAVDAAPDAEHGRGLALVHALSTTWGPLPSASGVFFTLTWPQAPPPVPDP